METFAKALSAYHLGDQSAAFNIRRDDGFEQKVPVRVFFENSEFPPLEESALSLCTGRVLDVGAAAGRHSLELIKRDLQVTSLDILPEVECILRERGVDRVVIANILSFSDEQFDTVLMLMNGIGMVGSFEALKGFLRSAHEIVRPNGQILCDSIDVSVTSDPVHVAYRKQNEKRGNPLGLQKLSMTFQEEAEEYFDWLHIDFPSLRETSKIEGWKTELIMQDEKGHFLCRLTKDID